MSMTNWPQPFLDAGFTDAEIVEGVKFDIYKVTSAYSGSGCAVVEAKELCKEMTFLLEHVADMLQGCLDRGERIDWPDGSPGCRFRKEEVEPTLLEAAESVIAHLKEGGCLVMTALLDAIEREKAKETQPK